MKKLLLRIMAVMAATGSLALAAEGWSEDFEAAKATAAKEKKTILLDFTGSDWCGWCIKLDKEVFAKKEFKDYAKDNLVLVTVDFPEKKKQSEKVQEQNQALSKKYKVEGYPTIILLDSDGKKIAQTGYQEGGPEKYVEHLKTLISQSKK